MHCLPTRHVRVFTKSFTLLPSPSLSASASPPPPLTLTACCNWRHLRISSKRRKDGSSSFLCCCLCFWCVSYILCRMGEVFGSGVREKEEESQQTARREAFWRKAADFGILMIPTVICLPTTTDTQALRSVCRLSR